MDFTVAGLKDGKDKVANSLIWKFFSGALQDGMFGPPRDK